jgi:hypothetical protein
MSIADLGTTIINVDDLSVQSLYLGGSATPLTHYDEVSLNGNFTGPYTANGVGLLRRIGNTVMITMNQTLGSSSASAVMTYGVTLPYTPGTVSNSPIWVQTANSSFSVGNCAISQTGIMTISISFNTAFAATGSVGFNGFTTCYTTTS